MPEGDTVYRAARLLDRHLTGQVLLSTDFRVPQHATADLSGGTVVGTVSRGKHLLTRVDRGEEAWTLHTHLKMEGSWHVYKHGTKWRRPAYQARVVLETEEWVTVGFDLGIVELVARDPEDSVTAYLGPDLRPNSGDEKWTAEPNYRTHNIAGGNLQDIPGLDRFTRTREYGTNPERFVRVSPAHCAGPRPRRSVDTRKEPTLRCPDCR